MKKWLIWYKHTFSGDSFEGTFEEAKEFAIEQIKNELAKANLTLPIPIDNCGVQEMCYSYEDFIEDIDEDDEEEN